ncbi:MAG: hypothetical protein ACOCUY_01055 [Verrucomicrobiota bacterium]
MLEFALQFVIGTVLSAACLWAGMKLTRVDGKFIAMIIIAAVSSILGQVPVVGWLLGLVVMFMLICKWTTAEFWPDAVLMVVVANVVGIVGAMALGSALAGM